MKYRVKLEKTDEGYAVWCPGLPGCWSQGATEEEALENVADAIGPHRARLQPEREWTIINPFGKLGAGHRKGK